VSHTRSTSCWFSYAAIFNQRILGIPFASANDDDYDEAAAIIISKIRREYNFAWRLLRHIAQRKNASLRSAESPASSIPLSRCLDMVTAECIDAVAEHMHRLCQEEDEWMEECLTRITPSVFLRIVESPQLDMNHYTSLTIYRALVSYTETNFNCTCTTFEDCHCQKGLSASEMIRVGKAIDRFCLRHQLLNCVACKEKSGNPTSPLGHKRPSFPKDLAELYIASPNLSSTPDLSTFWHETCKYAQKLDA